jgi:hypothetical protein
MTKFDINMTYHLKDDVPFTYFIDIDFYTKHWQHPILPKVRAIGAFLARVCARTEQRVQGKAGHDACAYTCVRGYTCRRPRHR